MIRSHTTHLHFHFICSTQDMLPKYTIYTLLQQHLSEYIHSVCVCVCCAGSASDKGSAGQAEKQCQGAGGGGVSRRDTTAL